MASSGTSAAGDVESHHSESQKAFGKDVLAGEKITPKDGGQGTSGTLPTVDEALSAMEAMVMDGRITSEHERNCLKALLSDHDNLKDKIGKLKSLLGRSAKAQREAKVELETTQKRLEDATRDVKRLNEKVEKLATRPTHMELLADFETNFDRALLSVNQQAGGESTAAPTAADSAGRGGTTKNPNDPDSAIVDDLLMQELQESKQRIEKLESLNSALLHRSSQLEGEAQDRRRERDELRNRVTHLELEKRMAVMEAEHATKTMQEKAASLAEMQMEIDLVSRASVKAQLRAAKDEELLKSVKTDQKHVHLLEAQVQALQEWATAAAEAKTLAQERVRLLEAQVRSLKEGAVSGDLTQQQILWEKKGSFVIGAGDIGYRIFECGNSVAVRGSTAKRVVLRWQFDLTAADLNVDFSAFQGRCESADDRKKAIADNRALIDNRLVKGGAAGDLDDAFFYQDACTLLWSNLKSWVRPRTVRFTVQAVSSGEGEGARGARVLYTMSPPSTRGLSRKNRVYVFREFILQVYGSDYLKQLDDTTTRSCCDNGGSSHNTTASVLDGAGGKGDLSWLLNNVDNIPSVIVDPRASSSSSDHILRSVTYLKRHPSIVAERSVPGLPTYQPLAPLVSQLPLDLSSIHKPFFMRVLVDDELVSAVRHYQHTQSLKDWDMYWQDAMIRAQKSETLSGRGREQQHGLDKDQEIANPEIALLDVLLRLRLIVGFHPDQATEALIDLALALAIPFAVVPCCVFPSEFPNRTNADGCRVRTYNEFLKYLKVKFPFVRIAKLPFHFTETAKNIVLYTLPEDIRLLRQEKGNNTSYSSGTIKLHS